MWYHLWFLRLLLLLLVGVYIGFSRCVGLLLLFLALLRLLCWLLAFICGVGVIGHCLGSQRRSRIKIHFSIGGACVSAGEMQRQSFEH